MPNVGTASLDLVVDKQQLGKSITEAVDGVKKPVSDKLNSFGKTMTKTLTLPIAAIFGATAKAASDLGESVNKSNVVFGKSASVIHDFSKSSAKDLGISQRAAEQAAGTFGNLFVSMKIGQQPAADMSKKLVGLAADLASFNNVSPEDALEALRSGLVGETEPLRKFGVNLNDAAIRTETMKLGLISTVKDALTPAAKAQASYSLILQQTTTAQGDFARTSDGMANQSRIMRAQFEDTAASIGQKVIPVALKFLDVANGLLSGFSSLPEPMQNMAIAGAAIVAAMGPLSLIVGNATKAVKALEVALTFLAANPALLAVAALAAGAAFLTFQWIRSGQQIAEVSAQLNSDFAPAVNNAALATKSHGDAMKTAAVNAYVQSKNLQDASEAQKRMAEQLPAATRQMETLAHASGLTNERVVQLANSMGVNLATATDAEKDKLAEAATALSRAITPAERLDTVTETLGNTAATTAEQFDAFKEALDAALGVQLTADQAAVRYQASIAALGTAVTENGTQVGTATEKQRELSLALIDVVGDAQSEVDALARSGRISADAAVQKQELINRLSDLQSKFPALRGPIQGYIDKINEIPTTKTTTVNVETFAATQKLDAFLRKLNAGSVSARTFEVPGSRLPKRAAGGPVFAHRPYIVGENHPELFVPNESGMIVPDYDSSHSWVGSAAIEGASTGGVVVLDGKVIGRVLASNLSDYERDGGSVPWST